MKGKGFRDEHSDGILQALIHSVFLVCPPPRLRPRSGSCTRNSFQGLRPTLISSESPRPVTTYHRLVRGEPPSPGQVSPWREPSRSHSGAPSAPLLSPVWLANLGEGKGLSRACRPTGHVRSGLCSARGEYWGGVAPRDGVGPVVPQPRPPLWPGNGPNRVLLPSQLSWP